MSTGRDATFLEGSVELPTGEQGTLVTFFGTCYPFSYAGTTQDNVYTYVTIDALVNETTWKVEDVKGHLITGAFSADERFEVSEFRAYDTTDSSVFYNPEATAQVAEIEARINEGIQAVRERIQADYADAGNAVCQECLAEKTYRYLGQERGVAVLLFIGSASMLLGSGKAEPFERFLMRLTAVLGGSMSLKEFFSASDDARSRAQSACAEACI